MGSKYSTKDKPNRTTDNDMIKGLTWVVEILRPARRVPADLPTDKGLGAEGQALLDVGQVAAHDGGQRGDGGTAAGEDILEDL